MNTITPAGQPEGDGVIRADLTADLTAARQARSAVRRALASWGMDPPAGDAELLASELAANAAGHAGGPVGLTLHRHAPPDGQRGITCEVTDISPTPAPATPGRPRRGTRPGPVDRHRPRHRHWRPRRAGRQDHLVHPRPPRAHRASVPATRVRSRGRSLTNS